MLLRLVPPYNSGKLPLASGIMKPVYYKVKLRILDLLPIILDGSKLGLAVINIQLLHELLILGEAGIILTHELHHCKFKVIMI